MTLKGDAIFKEKLTGGLKNDIRNLINFHASSRKSEHSQKFQMKKYRRVISYGIAFTLMFTPVLIVCSFLKDVSEFGSQHYLLSKILCHKWIIVMSQIFFFFLRVHAYSVILKAHLQIHIPFTFFYFQFRFEGVFEVIVNVECFIGSIYFSKRCSFETFRFQSSAN